MSSLRIDLIGWAAVVVVTTTVLWLQQTWYNQELAKARQAWVVLQCNSTFKTQTYDWKIMRTVTNRIVLECIKR